MKTKQEWLDDRVSEMLAEFELYFQDEKDVLAKAYEKGLGYFLEGKFKQLSQQWFSEAIPVFKE